MLTQFTSQLDMSHYLQHVQVVTVLVGNICKTSELQELHARLAPARELALCPLSLPCRTTIGGNKWDVGGDRRGALTAAMMHDLGMVTAIARNAATIQTPDGTPILAVVRR